VSGSLRIRAAILVMKPSRPGLRNTTGGGLGCTARSLRRRSHCQVESIQTDDLNTRSSGDWASLHRRFPEGTIHPDHAVWIERRSGSPDLSN
jgi:hypothetical protein